MQVNICKYSQEFASFHLLFLCRTWKQVSFTWDRTRISVIYSSLTMLDNDTYAWPTSLVFVYCLCLYAGSSQWSYSIISRLYKMVRWVLNISELVLLPYCVSFLHSTSSSVATCSNCLDLLHILLMNDSFSTKKLELIDDKSSFNNTICALNDDWIY